MPLLATVQRNPPVAWKSFSRVFLGWISTIPPIDFNRKSVRLICLKIASAIPGGSLLKFQRCSCLVWCELMWQNWVTKGSCTLNSQTVLIKYFSAQVTLNLSSNWLLMLLLHGFFSKGNALSHSCTSNALSAVSWVFNKETEHYGLKITPQTWRQSLSYSFCWNCSNGTLCWLWVKTDVSCLELYMLYSLQIPQDCGIWSAVLFSFLYYVYFPQRQQTGSLAIWHYCFKRHKKADHKFVDNLSCYLL